MNYMIISNKIGCRVVDLSEYTLGQILEEFDFWNSRCFDIEVEYDRL